MSLTLLHAYQVACEYDRRIYGLRTTDKSKIPSLEQFLKTESNIGKSDSE